MNPFRRLRRPRPEAAGPPDVRSTLDMWRWCTERGVATRPHYLWGTLHAARLARAIDEPCVTVAEFGVAGGNGLLALERAASEVEFLVGVDIAVVGFDTGTGLPPSSDPRDLPWLIEEGLFEMDEDALRARLTRAHLVLGDVAETVPQWKAGDHPPIGFASFDLDLYSGTAAALGVLDPVSAFPRVLCYFDDIFGAEWTDHVGERAAIDEFNQAPHDRKLGKIHGLAHQLPPGARDQRWPDQLYLAHLFDHPRYADHEGPADPVWAEGLRLRP